MGEGRHRGWVHVATEFLIVFVSVVLALLANDWRQRQIDRGQERQALTLILRDLREDSVQLHEYGTQLLRQDSAAAWLVTNIDRPGVPADSVLTAVVGVTRYYNYRPEFPTYDGLKASGRLGLIRDPGLHDAVVRYFDFFVPYLNDLRQGVRNRSLNTRQGQLRHFIPRPPPGARVFSVQESDVARSWTRTTSIASIRADREYLGEVASVGVSTAWLVSRVDTLFLPQSRQLQALIRQQLGSSGGH